MLLDKLGGFADNLRHRALDWLLTELYEVLDCHSSGKVHAALNLHTKTCNEEGLALITELAEQRREVLGFD